MIKYRKWLSLGSGFVVYTRLPVDFDGKGRRGQDGIEKDVLRGGSVNSVVVVFYGGGCACIG